MPDAQSFPDPASGRTDFLQPFECSCMDGTLDAAWVRVAGALDIATTLGPAASPAGSRQRSLVSSSLLRSDGHARGGRRSH
jgi:hypothetical protein